MFCCGLIRFYFEVLYFQLVCYYVLEFKGLVFCLVDLLFFILKNIVDGNQLCLVEELIKLFDFDSLWGILSIFRLVEYFILF